MNADRAIEIVADALRVLRTRDGIDVPDALIEERARIAVEALDIGPRAAVTDAAVTVAALLADPLDPDTRASARIWLRDWKGAHDRAAAEKSRRRIAAVDQGEARALVLRCTTTERCSFHRDGGPEAEKCPGVCDADGCSLDGEIEVGGDRALCNAHAGLLLLAGSMRDVLAADDTKGGR